MPPRKGEVRFSGLDIPRPLLHAACDLGFEYCTPIQQQSLSYTLSGRDVGGRAQTGTGKTAAFLLTALSRIINTPRSDDRPGAARVLVLAPTRELAIQIHKDAEALAKYVDAHCVAVFGGMDYRKQQRELEHPVDILVATPGRLLDYRRQRLVHLSCVELLVIDEADRMLDMGFIPDVRRIVLSCPRPGKRQTMMWSATLTPEVLRLADSWLHEPEMIEIEPENVVAGSIDQLFYTVTEEQKFPLLFWHLKHDDVERMLIFANRKDRCERIYHKLMQHSVGCALLTGDVPQKKRLRVLEAFRSGQTPVIVATDVAARGIHVDNVSHVVNFDLPFEVEDYVHRIGRTGRAGETGTSISFADEYGSYIIPDLEEYLGEEIRSELPPEEMTTFELPPKVDISHLKRRRSSRSRNRSGGGRGKGRGRPRGRRGPPRRRR